jgi:uncharacterized delta-60 repeat protein
MPAQVKVSETWRNMTAPYLKVNNSWKMAKSAWTKVSGSWKRWFVQGGILDSPVHGVFAPNFNTNIGIGADGEVSSITTQSDGKIVLAGGFSNLNGKTANNVVRINADGTLDRDFAANIGTGPNSQVLSVIIQSDGKILIGGFFTTFNGTPAVRLARLNPDGTLDTTFSTNVGTRFNSTVRSIAVQSDGKILVGGNFSGFSTFAFLRLNSNGTLDDSFSVGQGFRLNGANGTVFDIKIQSDGKIIVVGSFTSYSNSTNDASRIVRLNSDGTRDFSFSQNLFNDQILKAHIQADGKVIVGGLFTVNGNIPNRIARLNSNGSLDTTFNTNVGSGASGAINSLATQSDGRIILGGAFTAFNGTTVNRIARLNSSGTLDTVFTTNNGVGANSTITSIEIQSDNKILIGGLFFTFQQTGHRASRPLQLNSDGGVVQVLDGADGIVSAVAIQPDSKIVIGGHFRKFNGTTVNFIARLNPNGILDTTFTTNNGTGIPDTAAIYEVTVRGLAIQSDGKIVLVGGFTQFNGEIVNYIVRLNSNGTLDTAFRANTLNGFSGISQSVAIQPDGKILIGGFSFTSFNLTTVNRIARLNSNGTLDTAFTTNTGTGANFAIYSIAVQSDGKILLAGEFTTFNGTTVNRIVRLNSDGTRDTEFTTNTGTGSPNAIFSVAIQSDGKILIGGVFATFNGTTVNRIARLNPNGTLDTNFDTNTGTGTGAIGGAVNTVNSIAIQPDGKIVIGGEFTSFNGITVNRIVRLNSDGTTDTSFTTNAGTGNNSSVDAIAIQPSDETIILGGNFTTFNDVNARRLVRISGAIAGE